MKKILGYSSLIFLGIIIGIMSLEILLRLAGFSKEPYESTKNYFIYDPALGIDINPQFETGYDLFDSGRTKVKIWSNELGCFDLPYRKETPYILLVGDSFAWGYTPFEQKWGTLSEQYIGQRILKCGVGGYGTKQEFLKTKKIISQIKKNPSLIIVAYNPNDLNDDYLFPIDTVTHEMRVTKVTFKDFKTGSLKVSSPQQLEGSLKNWKKYCVTFKPKHPIIQRSVCILKNNLVSYPFIKKMAHIILLQLEGDAGLAQLRSAEDAMSWEEGNMAFIATTTYPWIARAWDEHMQNIREFKKFADAHNAKLLFVMLPLKPQVYNYFQKDLPQDAHIENIQKIIIPFLEREKIAYIDMLPAFQEKADQTEKKYLNSQKDLYWRFDNHWNPKGNKLAGLLVSKYILEQDLVKLPESEKQQRLSAIEQELSVFK